MTCLESHLRNRLKTHLRSAILIDRAHALRCASVEEHCCAPCHRGDRRRGMADPRVVPSPAASGDVRQTYQHRTPSEDSDRAFQSSRSRGQAGCLARNNRSVCARVMPFGQAEIILLLHM